MKKYEVLIYEVLYRTNLYEIEARGEKEARRKGLREHKFEDPAEIWITGWKIEGEKVILVGNGEEV